MARLRADADAVMIGAATCRADDPTLGVADPRLRARRRREGLPEEPLRCIVTRRGRLDPTLRVFTHPSPAPPIVLLPTRSPAVTLRKLAASATVVEAGRSRKGVVPEEAVHILEHRFGVRHLLLEGGGDLHHQWLAAGLVDEIHVTLCPVLLAGGAAAPTLCDGPAFDPGSGIVELELIGSRRGGAELFLHYRVVGRTRLERRAVPSWKI